MNSRNCLAAAILLFFFTTSWAQNGISDLTFLKGGMSSIVSKNAKIRKIADGFSFTEGPVWHPDGYLLFSDIPANKIFKYDPSDGISIFLENSGYVGTDENKDGPGSNGLTLDQTGNLIICQHGARQIIQLGADSTLLPLARQFKGRRLNSPNDVVVKTDGSLYFTDPPWGLPKNEKDPAKELDFQGVYRLRNRNLEVLDGKLSSPNGIAFSPDERFLYVSDSEDGKKLYYKYTLDETGNVRERALFFDATNIVGKGGPDGIKVDNKGNCYFTGPGGILVVNSKGTHLGTITPPEQPSNLCWGGKDRKTLFMTCRTGLYAIDLKVRGAKSAK